MTRKLELPKTKEVEGLPLPLKVACVIRAADRVYPIVERFNSSEYLETIQKGTQAAIAFATGEDRPYTDLAFTYWLASLRADCYASTADDAVRRHATFGVQLDLRKGLIEDHKALVQLSWDTDYLNETLPIWHGAIPAWYENPDLLSR